MHYSGYLVCATPLTVLNQSIGTLQAFFIMVYRCACGFGIVINLFLLLFFFFLLLNLTIFAAQVVRQGMFDGKHIVGGIAFYKHIVYILVLFVKQLFLMQMVDPDQIHILKCLFCLPMSMFCEFFYAPIFRSDSCRNCITSLLKRVLLLTGHDDGLLFYVPFKLC